MHFRSRFTAALLALFSTPAFSQEDYGACVGPAPGTMTSPSSSAWYCLSGEGPGGADCMASGPLFDQWDTSVVELALTGPGILSFQWKCSSAPGDTLSLNMQVPGGYLEVNALSGEQPWQSVEVFVPPGERKVRWIYRNNAPATVGEDAGRVAEVHWKSYGSVAAGSFGDWKSSQGLTPDAKLTAAGYRIDTAWLMGLSATGPVPAGMLTPVVENGEVRCRVPLSKSAPGILRMEYSDGSAGWSHAAVRSRLVPASDAGENLVMEYSIPSGLGRGLIRFAHQTIHTPPSGFAFIPEGSFLMSSPLFEYGRLNTENYRHEVTLTRPFFLRTTETTYPEWIEHQTWARANGYPRLAVKTSSGFDEEMAHDGMPGAGRDDSGPHPVVDVNWYETIKWLNAKSDRDGLAPCYYVRLRDLSVVVFRTQSLDEIDPNITALICDWNANGWRLPSEAEWEYACRGGVEAALSNGRELIFTEPGTPVDDGLDPVAWYGANSDGLTHPVGKKQPNPFGLYDMHGNAGEWTWDAYRDGSLVPYAPDPVVNPAGGSTNGHIYRIHRGGGWKLSAKWARSAARGWVVPTVQALNQIGFRYCRNAE